MSESSYNKAGEPLKDAVQKGDNVPNGEDLFDALFEWMPNDDFPIPDVSPRDRSLTTEADVAELRELPTSRFFNNGQTKKSPVMARSFTDEFIDSKAGGPETDEELFRRYQQGDDKAFFSLYERYKGSVFAYCSKVLLSAGLAEELVQDTYQEVFLRVSQYRNTFTQGEFRAWIFTITRNTCLSWKKRGLKGVMTSGAFDPDHLTEEQALASPSNVQRSQDPLELLTQKEQTDMLLKAISELPETYREALMLCEYEGLTYEEIGRLTGTSLSTIRIRVFRAKKRLRKILQPMMGVRYATNIGKEAENEDE